MPDVVDPVLGLKWAEALLTAQLFVTGSIAPNMSQEVVRPVVPVVHRVGSSIGENWVCPQPLRLQSSAPLRITVEEMRSFCGLTASQIGRLFGVSRRSVNNWMAGSPMALRHQQRLDELQRILLELPGSSPDERRAALFESSHGASLFHGLVAQVAEGPVLQTNPLGARDQF